jgi:hypothetical protein
MLNSHVQHTSVSVKYLYVVFRVVNSLNMFSAPYPTAEIIKCNYLIKNITTGNERWLKQTELLSCYTICTYTFIF